MPYVLLKLVIDALLGPLLRVLGHLWLGLFGLRPSGTDDEDQLVMLAGGVGVLLVMYGTVHGLGALA